MMEHRAQLITELQKLMKSDGIKRSKMGLVFEIYDTLLELRSSGVKAADIEDLLNDPSGVFNFKLPKGSLTSYMHRIKLKKAASQVERRGAVVAVAPVALPKTQKAKSPARPVELDERKTVAPELARSEAPTKQQMISMQGLGRPRNGHKPKKPE
jgi:hypothetical protein